MRALVFPFILALLALPAHAAYYVTVVDDAALASDVVNAANFAASMKASAGVSFTGVLASEAPMRIAVRSDPVMRVDLRGMEATILADEGEFSGVIDVATRYLEGQGFDVRVNPSEGNGRMQRVPLDIEDETPQERLTEDVPADDTQDIEELEEDVVQPVEDDLPVDAAPDAQEPPTPGVFSRFWGWLKGLFN